MNPEKKGSQSFRQGTVKKMYEWEGFHLKGSGAV